MVRRGKSAWAAGKVSIAVMVSRILGLVRDQVFAGLFGAGVYNDAWLVAFRIPNLLRDLFAEGALSSAFVPTFTDHLHRKGRAEAWLLANLVLSTLLIALGAVALFLFVFSDFLVYLLAAGFEEIPGKVELTARLTQILAPFLLFVAMASVGMGILNALDHFFLPALAPALFNIALILAGFFLAPTFEHWGIPSIYAMAVGAVVGGFLQYAIQIPLLRRHGFRFRFSINFHHEGLQRMMRLMAPAVFGISATELNIIVTTQLASFLGNGPVSWLNYAFRVLYLPIGLFGVAIGSVNLRDVSFHAARQEWESLKESVANSLKLLSLVAMPATTGLMVLSIPITGVLFERGQFTSQDTQWTAYALIFYSLGLFSYSCIKIFAPTFYALGDTRTPVRASIVSVLVNITANLFLVWLLPGPYKYIGLAFGTTLSVSVNILVLSSRFRRRMGSLKRFRVSQALIRTTAAALVMAGVVYVVHFYLARFSGNQSEVAAQAAILGLSITVGMVVYFAVCQLLGVEEVRYVLRRLRR
ncbi:MAG: murein biosynthesis integral membrane protein MurJ [Acidobacteria bacterium]|nr:murein biosynthesis integral membrane protein MurJ [Acidobacteriota bacterium]